MLIKDDIKAITGALAPLIKAEGEAIRNELVTKNDLEANNKIFAQIVRIETAAVKQEIIDAMKAGFNETGKMIGEVKKELYNKRLEQLEERVRNLEKQQAKNLH